MKKIVGFILLIGIIGSSIIANAFSSRTTKPEDNDWHYYSSTNPYYSSGLVGECTWYVWGRAYEILGKSPGYATFPGAGKDIYGNCSGLYQRGSTPKVGAIACWANGTNGHVAIVEKIENGIVYVSHYNINWDHKFSYGVMPNLANFQGYVYLIDSTTPPSAPTNCLAGSWDDRVQIQWDRVDNADIYECGLIDKTTNNVILKHEVNDWYYNFYGVPEGEYYAYVCAKNSAGNSQHSNWASVTVKYTTPSDPTTKDISFTSKPIETDVYTIRSEITNLNQSATYYVASYTSNGRLIEINSKPVNSEDTECELSLSKNKDIAYFKAFLWDSNLKPLTSTNKIDINDISK